MANSFVGMFMMRKIRGRLKSKELLLDVIWEVIMEQCKYKFFQSQRRGFEFLFGILPVDGMEDRLLPFQKSCQNFTWNVSHILIGLYQKSSWFNCTPPLTQGEYRVGGNRGYTIWLNFGEYQKFIFAFPYMEILRTSSNDWIREPLWDFTHVVWILICDAL